jgi:tRNA threonylcarbamoyladenosine biosynthesis protein TsaE
MEAEAPSPTPTTVRSRSAEETREFARSLAGRLPRRCVLALHGDLGSGKTCLVQGLARALGLEEVVNSPTYTLVHEYPGPRPLQHVDLYRIAGPREALALGLDEVLDRDGITAIEWAERAGDLLPATAIHVVLEHGSAPDERLITVRWGTPP